MRWLWWVNFCLSKYYELYCIFVMCFSMFMMRVLFIEILSLRMCWLISEVVLRLLILDLLSCLVKGWCNLYWCVCIKLWECFIIWYLSKWNGCWLWIIVLIFICLELCFMSCLWVNFCWDGLFFFLRKLWLMFDLMKLFCRFLRKN